VEGLQYCINKYWKPNPSVVLLGYNEPPFNLDDNFEFISLGKDRGVGNIGNDLINFFNSIEDKYFIFTVDDFFPIREVDVDLLDYLKGKMIKEDISRIPLIDQVSNKPNSIIEKNNNFTLKKLILQYNYS